MTRQQTAEMVYVLVESVGIVGSPQTQGQLDSLGTIGHTFDGSGSGLAPTDTTTRAERELGPRTLLVLMGAVDGIGGAIVPAALVYAGKPLAKVATVS